MTLTLPRTLPRIAMAGLAVAVLASCGAGLRTPGASNAAPVAANIQRTGPASQAGFERFVNDFRLHAIAAGIQPAVYDRSLAGARYNPEVIRLDRRQAEFSKPVWEYLDGAVSSSRVSTGRQKQSQLASTLGAIENRYGVDREVVLAVWGMESNFGANRGTTRIIPAVATLAYDGRRGEMFQQQLVAALRIIQAGDVTPEGMVGSWAGAMGHTQFMPTSYLSHAVDFTGDGKRDIWSDDPTDSLASTAAYLARSGWTRGLPWGVEVVLPQGFDFNQVGRDNRRAGGAWAGMGVRTASGAAMPGWQGAILAPAGARGPAFLVSSNFTALRTYNASDNYVMGVGMLGDAIAGRGGVRGSWPRGDAQLSNAQKTQIQTRLNALGFNAGKADGMLGSQSIEAIKAFQRSRGMTPDGYATTALLSALR
ncbi:lytic murein transglycosylase [Paracoccus sp. S-4012]|uniref:lytic murein transglycosylase n=1 Tax=Paracoccus sp. S-4012 TaxID=2665648 RepID=UPI0012B04813|nr:lytic murein transglycosylase [Paracoccus sp. S-4012]MRX50943.1 lytic murein transglycosylase [Paracoccus sp. S-4012]